VCAHKHNIWLSLGSNMNKIQMESLGGRLHSQSQKSNRCISPWATEMNSITNLQVIIYILQQNKLHLKINNEPFSSIRLCRSGKATSHSTRNSNIYTCRDVLNGPSAHSPTSGTFYSEGHLLWASILSVQNPLCLKLLQRSNCWSFTASSVSRVRSFLLVYIVSLKSF